ncbi:unnamed protein product [Ascophyllum nodosum]
MNFSAGRRKRYALAISALGFGYSGVDCFLGTTWISHTVRAPSHESVHVVFGASSRQGSTQALTTPRMTTTVEIESFPYEDVLPFLAEHVQPSDQILVFGCGTELPLRLSRDGYGTRDTRSLIRCIDSDPHLVAAMEARAKEDPVCAKNMQNGRLFFEALDVTSGMPELEQSSVDSVVDVGLLDKLVITMGLDAARTCSEAAHRAVRLGNPLVALSKIDRDDYAAIFDGNFGWVQELDGDPGAISQWYRTKKVNLRDVANNFGDLGLSFFVYTNIDNC